MVKKGKRRNKERADNDVVQEPIVPTTVKDIPNTKGSKGIKLIPNKPKAIETVEDEIDSQSDLESDDDVLYRLNSDKRLEATVDTSPSPPTRGTRGGSHDAVRTYLAARNRRRRVSITSRQHGRIRPLL